MLTRFWLPLVLALGGCAGDRGSPAPAGTLRVGTNNEITAPSPFSDRGLGARIEELVFRGLLRWDSSGRWRGDLAEAWAFDETGRRLVLRLRPGVRFSDGSGVTAQDVVASLRRAMGLRIWGSEQIADARAVDDRTVEVVPVRPHLVPAGLIIGITRGGGVTAVGAGPYVTGERNADRLVLHVNPHFSGAAPGLSQIEFHRFDKTSDEWGRLLAREVDLITLVPWAKHEFLRTVPTIREVTTLLQAVMVIGLVRPSPPFDRPAVRYALALAVDRQSLIQSAVRGHGQPAAGPVWPSSELFDPELHPYVYDPARARQILAANGITPDTDGTLRWDGRPLQLALKYLAGYTEIEETALVLQRQLAELGLRVDLESNSQAEMGPAVLSGVAGTYLMYRHASSDLLSDPDARAVLATSTASDGAATNPRALQRRMRDQPPSIYLFWPERLDVIDQRFCGLPRLPDGPEADLHLVHACAAGEAQ